MCCQQLLSRLIGDVHGDSVLLAAEHGIVVTQRWDVHIKRARCAFVDTQLQRNVCGCHRPATFNARLNDDVLYQISAVDERVVHRENLSWLDAEHVV